MNDFRKVVELHKCASSLFILKIKSDVDKLMFNGVSREEAEKIVYKDLEKYEKAILDFRNEYKNSID